MQAEQSIAGCTDLFASLHAVQATVQTQVTRFNQLMADIRTVASERQDEAGVNAVGDIALTLHRVHALLYSGAATAAPQPQAEAAPAGAGFDLQDALSEFSALLSTSQNTSQEVAALLDAAEEALKQLRSPAN
ncbi:MAG TPA: hypothetical protein VIN58_20430 [Roseateles sp.]